MFPDIEGDASTNETERESEDPGDQGPIPCGRTETYHQPKLAATLRIANFKA
jgi:hypothetical protein